LNPLSFLLGVAAFTAAATLKKPLRKAAVVVTSQVIGLIDQVKASAYGIKEEIEDIVAEAQYENMKKNMEVVGEGESANDSEPNEEA